MPSGLGRPGRSRPPSGRPLMPGRLAKCDTPCRSEHNSNVSGVHVPYIGENVSRLPTSLAMDARSVYLASRSAPRVPARSVHPGYHPPLARRLYRRCAPPHALPSHGHTCLGTQPRVFSLRPSAYFASRLPSDSVTGARPAPPSDLSGGQSLY